MKIWKGRRESESPTAERDLPYTDGYCSSRGCVINGFAGFPEELFRFLKDLTKNNNKSWFAENKDRYIRYAREPAVEFVVAMRDRLSRISQSYIADPRTNGGSMFRIYRDTRFSKNKLPYKENIGFQFRHIAGKDAHAPGYYVHIQPGKSFAGGGIWLPPTKILNKVRDAMIRNTDEWLKIKKFVAESGDVDFMERDRLKRAPQGYPPGHPIIEDLKRKTVFAGRNFSDNEVTSADFINEIEAVFLDVVPLMRFINEALGLSF